LLISEHSNLTLPFGIDERIITDLTGDGSAGWDTDGFALSSDGKSCEPWF